MPNLLTCSRRSEPNAEPVGSILMNPGTRVGGHHPLLGGSRIWDRNVGPEALCMVRATPQIGTAYVRDAQIATGLVAPA
jgi:hypothetical protein